MVSRRIFVIALIPRIASQNPVAPFERTTDRPVFLHGFNEVSAASWLESTIAAQHRTDGFLIKPDHQNQDKPRNGNDELKKVRSTINITRVLRINYDVFLLDSRTPSAGRTATGSADTSAARTDTATTDAFAGCSNPARRNSSASCAQPAERCGNGRRRIDEGKTCTFYSSITQELRVMSLPDSSASLAS